MINPVRRKVFISYYKGDQEAVQAFADKYSDVFITKALGIGYDPQLIDSNDTEYVMGRIRTEFLADSTVTIVLVGSCTHSRRYVDWEIKASLRQGSVYTPNGLLGIMLPGNSSVYLPRRFELNWERGEQNCYARFRHMPATKDDLRRWIEDAFEARTTRAHLIENPQDRMGYNGKCLVHGVTH
ncbi:MAG TPA: TIR domain-containing protein [Symbiobacteriaceae bacterium]|nr:TIR domain-containing protein [Symbiobacteriaceae bacterium]